MKLAEITEEGTVPDGTDAAIFRDWVGYVDCPSCGTEFIARGENIVHIDRIGGRITSDYVVLCPRRHCSHAVKFAEVHPESLRPEKSDHFAVPKEMLRFVPTVALPAASVDVSQLAVPVEKQGNGTRYKATCDCRQCISPPSDPATHDPVSMQFERSGRALSFMKSE